jgi:hypothetical protein
LPDYTLEDGTEANLLDVIRVGVRFIRAMPHQPENWVIDRNPWTLLSRPMDNDLIPILQNAIVQGPELLGNSSDRVPYASYQQKRSSESLALIAPDSIDLYCQLSYRGSPQARGRFSLGAGAQACPYDLAITDPHWESRIIHQGPHTLRQASIRFVVTISIGEPFGFYCYKLIAAIIPLPGSIVAAI